MEKNRQIWHRKASPVFTAVLIYSIAAALATLISSVVWPSAMFRMDGVLIFFYILEVVYILGLILFIIALTHFGAILDHEDSQSIGNIRTGASLNLIGVGLTLIPFMGWVGGILNILGWVLMLVGYMSLKNSVSFPAKARKGASNLFLAMIISLIGGIVMLIFGWIPIIRLVVGLIVFAVYAIAFVLMLSGWINIKDADPDVM